MAEARYRGEVVKLDRGYPLVRLEDGELLRCEHATALVKGERRRAVIGDVVEVAVPPAHDKGVIEAIAPRTREFVRKDPTERVAAQVFVIGEAAKAPGNAVLATGDALDAALQI